MSKSIPILMNGMMVRQTTAGLKTQTRRPMMPQPVSDEQADHGDVVVIDGKPMRMLDKGAGLDYYDLASPFGVPGDLLWVREAFYVDHMSVAYGGKLPASMPDGWDEMLYWRADSSRGSCCDLIPECTHGDDGKGARWRPSIHMPLWASRLVLRVKDIRVERLQDVSELDAIAEGMSRDACEEIFAAAARRTKRMQCFYVQNRQGNDLEVEFCRPCGEKEAAKVGGIVCEGSSEVDTPCWCETCGILLDGYSLTEYGISRELYLDGMTNHAANFPARGSDAAIARDLSCNVPDKWLGRLAQIGLATLWDAIYGTDAWKANPWVFAGTFEVAAKTHAEAQKLLREVAP